jgi:hypothetical protein
MARGGGKKKRTARAAASVELAASAAECLASADGGPKSVPTLATSHGTITGVAKATASSSPGPSDGGVKMAPTVGPIPCASAGVAALIVSPSPHASLGASDDGGATMVPTVGSSPDASDGVMASIVGPSPGASLGVIDGGAKRVPTVAPSHGTSDEGAKPMASSQRVTLPPPAVQIGEPRPSSTPQATVSQSNSPTPDQPHKPLEHPSDMETDLELVKPSKFSGQVDMEPVGEGIALLSLSESSSQVAKRKPTPSPLSADFFMKSLSSIALEQVLPLWHPGVSEKKSNSIDPVTDRHCFFSADGPKFPSPYLIEDDQNNFVSTVVDFFKSIFNGNPADAVCMGQCVPHCKSIVVTSPLRIIAAISYYPVPSGNAVVAAFATDELHRDVGWGTFLIRATMAALELMGFPSPHLYLQCQKKEPGSQTPYEFYLRQGFSETYKKRGKYPGKNRSGVTIIPHDLQAVLKEIPTMLVVPEKGAKSLRWLDLGKAGILLHSAGSGVPMPVTVSLPATLGQVQDFEMKKKIPRKEKSVWSLNDFEDGNRNPADALVSYAAFPFPGVTIAQGLRIVQGLTMIRPRTLPLSPGISSGLVVRRPLHGNGYVKITKREDRLSDDWLIGTELDMLLHFVDFDGELDKELHIFPTELTALASHLDEDLFNSDDNAFKSFHYKLCRVQRYAQKHPGVLNRSYIYFPINQDNSHWTAILAINPLDATRATTGSPCGYLVFNSLGQTTKPTCPPSGNGFFLFLTLLWRFTRRLEDGTTKEDMVFSSFSHFKAWFFKQSLMPFSTDKLRPHQQFPQYLIPCGSPNLLAQFNYDDCGFCSLAFLISMMTQVFMEGEDCFYPDNDSPVIPYFNFGYRDYQVPMNQKFVMGKALVDQSGLFGKATQQAAFLQHFRTQCLAVVDRTAATMLVTDSLPQEQQLAVTKCFNRMQDRESHYFCKGQVSPTLPLTHKMYGSVNGEPWCPVGPDGVAPYSSILPPPRPPSEIQVAAPVAVDDPPEPIVEEKLTTQKEDEAASTLLQLHPFPASSPANLGDEINVNVADDDQSLNPDCLGEVPIGFQEEHSIMVPSLADDGKPIHHAIKDWVDQCFRDQTPPMDTPDEIRRTIHIWTYDHIAAIKQDLKACMRETRRQFLKMKIARLRDVIREEQQSLDINVKYFTDIYLKSTRTVVTGLSFVPDKCNKRDGHFVGLFEYDGHRTGKRVREEIAVDEGWTEEALEPGIAAYVKKMTISKTIDPESFFDIPPTTAYLDMRPIWKVNYYPERTVVESVVETATQARERGHKSADGLYKKKVKTRTAPEKWKVMYQDRSMEVKSRKFLVERFGKTYLNLVKAGASKKGFFPVPPGSAKDKGANLIPVPTPRAAAVKVKYPQKQLNTCVFSSFASALNHAGFVEHAARVNLAGIDRFFKSPKPMQDLCQFVRGELCLGLHITKFGHSTTVGDLAAATSDNIVLVLLCGSDQRSDHVVAIYNDLIFDSNVEMAMPFCRENLDYCCTDSTGEPSFSYFVKGYTFHRKAGMGAGRSKKKQKRVT